MTNESGSGSSTSRLRRTTLWIVVLVGGGTLLHLTSTILLPIAFAAMAATVFAGIARKLEDWGTPPVIATVICCLTLAGLTAGLVALFASAIRSVSSRSAEYAQRIEDGLNRASELSSRHLEMDLVEQLRANQFGVGELNMQDVLINARSALALLGSWALFALFFIVFLHFRSDFRGRIAQCWGPETQSDQRDRVIRTAQSTIERYLRLKLVISVGTAIVIGVACWAFSLDFTPAWILVTFAFNFVPSIGPVLAAVPPVLVGWAQGGLDLAFLLTLTLGGIHFLSGNVIEPTVIGRGLRMNFLAVILSLLVWNLIWGIPGMFLAVPLTACFKVLLDHGLGPEVLRIWMAPLGAASEQKRTEMKDEEPMVVNTAPKSG